MLVLLLGLVIFLGVHTIPTQPNWRTAIVGWFGEVGYKVLFSLVSLMGFVVLAYGFSSREMIQPFVAPFWTRHIAHSLMPFAFILLAAAYLPPGRIKAMAKHPMLVAVKLWALVHLIANWDVGSLVLFGSLLSWAVYDRISVKKRDVAVAEAGPAKNDVIAVIVGLALYAAFAFWLHPILFGVAVFG